ncbi:transcriptional protein SWT1 isoform X2 [Paramisgurnus dabryanus]|uniref:transcriptional protein SWT1 isoform X2 n=1 Tax=Paramisgurnus dabryanus TaxID=90735 RepID=UPI0031F433D0
MSSKKSKRRKHKKEERVPSSSSRDDDKKERENRRFDSPKSHRHHHHRRHESKDEAERRRARYSTSSRNISPKKARLTKTDVGQIKSKEKSSPESKSNDKSRTVKSHITQEKEKKTAERKHENASHTTSGRRSSATNQSSSKELETQKQKLVSRRSAPEKPRPSQEDNPSQDLKEQRRKLLKRSLSPDAKQRDIKKQTSNNSSHKDPQAVVQKETNETLVSRMSKEFDQIVQKSTAKSTYLKTLNTHLKEALPLVKHVDPAVKPKILEDLSLKQQGEERPSSTPIPKISFKIPKKGKSVKPLNICTVKAQTNTNLTHVPVSTDSKTRCDTQPCLPKTAAASPSNAFLASQQQRQKPQNTNVPVSTDTRTRWDVQSCLPKTAAASPSNTFLASQQQRQKPQNTNVPVSTDTRTRWDAQSCLPKTAAASSSNTFLSPQQQRQKPQNILGQTSDSPSVNCSSHLLNLSSAVAVQQVQVDKSRDVATPSNTSCEEICNVHSSAQEQKEEYHLKSQDLAETFDCDYEMELVEELHLARSERRLEVNLVENCGELTCMDIDPPEEGISAMLNEGQHKKSLLIVLDTNVLLSHLEFVKKIKSNGLAALGFPTLLIPWVVLQELDYLKSGKLSSKVEDKARPAVHYIYSCLKNQEPRLLGQSMQQASQAVCGLGVVNNDDRVLQCCLQYQDLYPDGALVLCTDDKNLCSKALLSGVKALSKADLVKEVNENSLAILNYPRAPPTASSPAAPVEKGSHTEKATWQEKKHEAVEERQLSECVSVLESCLLGALSEVLEVEMKAAFGDLWTEIVYVKPPWSLEGILKCFKKHWIAVFGNIIKRSLLSSVEMLSDYLCSNRSTDHTCRSVLGAVRGAAELLSALAGRSQYSGRVDHALSSLHMLQQRLQAPKTPVRTDDDDEDSLMAEIEEDETPPPHTCHQEVWSLFESIWNNVCQISSALFSALHYSPGATEPCLQATSHPPREALSCLHRVSTGLTQLLEALQRVLSLDSSVQDAQLLLSFIKTSEIAAMEPRFTARDLFDCLSQQEYREKLCVGAAQLSELSANLDHCAAAFSSWT